MVEPSQINQLNGENQSQQPPGLVISSPPPAPPPKQPRKRIRGDLTQMKTDVRQVAFFDMIHNAFLCFCGCYSAYDFLVFIKDVKQAMDYQRHLSKNQLHTNSTINTAAMGNSSSINVTTTTAATPEVTTSKGNFKRLHDAGIEDPFDVNLTAYKAIVGLCIVTAILAGAGIWTALRLHKGTDLNRSRTESRHWSRAWPILNFILAFFLFLGSTLAIVIINRTGAILLFMFAIKLISAIIVQRMMRELAVQEVQGPVVTTPIAITVTPPSSTLPMN